MTVNDYQSIPPVIKMMFRARDHLVMWKDYFDSEQERQVCAKAIGELDKVPESNPTLGVYPVLVSEWESMFRKMERAQMAQRSWE